MANSPIPVGQTFAGKYRVDRVLGEGGMGIVVAAHHLELDQPVAIKFLLEDLSGNPEGAERFRREARAAAKIQSDHVVRVLDVGLLDSGERFMVMEFLDGHDLAEEITNKGQLPVSVACNYLIEALDAVGQAHAVGIVHRDLKPANLYLARRADGRFRIKVLDFGISKTFGAASTSELSLTKTSAWIGSPLYMSPEQMQSARDVDHRADIWSLGAILYEMLSGRPPYLAESLPQLCNLLLTRDPDPITEIAPGIPLELAEIVHRCLARNINERIANASELAVALGRFVGSATAGNSLSAQLLARTEALSSPPVGATTGARSSLPSIPGGAGLSATPAPAAWGATQQGPNEQRSKLPLYAGLAALIAISGGLFVVFGGGGSDAKDVVTSPAAATQITSAPSAPEVAMTPTPAASAAIPPAAPTPAASSSPTPPAEPVKTSRPTTKVVKPKTTSSGDSDFGGRR